MYPVKATGMLRDSAPLGYKGCPSLIVHGPILLGHSIRVYPYATGNKAISASQQGRFQVIDM